jgi:eukaryotic-like serine/threonine-protein kinase
MSSCPGEGTLLLLGTDALGDGTYSAIEEHVEGCAQCKAVLERLAHRRRNPTVVLPDLERSPRIDGFEIKSELGRGAMGVVYLAIEPGLDRLVALKVLPGALAPDASTGPRRRWLREARAVSSVPHPNVVPLYDFGEADGCFFLVLEYVPGGTLKKRLTEPLPPRVAAGLMETVARAVGYVHGRGLLHLDLKPSNILLNCEDNDPWDRVTPRISDFGLALPNDCAGASETSLAGIRGTPSYMAPEQAAAPRGQFGAVTDVHALGAILYELLTGRPPFQGASTLETLDQVRHQNPVPPRRLNPKIPRDLETISLKCLEKNPSRRYASAEALAGDLRRWLDGRPIAARPVSPIEHAWRWCRRRPAIAILAAAFLLALTGGFLGMSVLWRRAEFERKRAERERSQAQAAQARAESDTRTAIGLVGQLIELNAGGTDATPRVFSLEDSAALLESTRRHFLTLAPREPDRERFFAQLLSLDGRLQGVLSDLHRWDELQKLLEESIRESEAAVGRHPRTTSAWFCQVRYHPILASIAETQGRTSDCEAHYRRAVACAEEWSRIDPRGEPLGNLVVCRKSLARRLAPWGRPSEARDLLLANQHSLQRCAREIVDEMIVAERALNYLEFRHLALGPIPPLTAEDTGHPDTGAFFGSAASDDLPATAWANRAAASLHLGDQSVSANFREAKVDFRFAQGLILIAGDQRHWGQFDRARQTVDRLLAFGRLVVGRHPKDPLGYVVLSDAFEQVQKNAWRPTEDRPTIELSLRQAIESTQHALDLDPYDEVTRHQMERLRWKLHNLLHP